MFASKECAVASAVRCCQVFSVWLHPLEHGLLQRATFHFYCHVQIFSDIGDLAMLVIALRSDVFHLLRAKGPGWVLLVFARHLPLQHTIFHIQLCHTQLFTYNLFYFSILHHLLYLSFLPRPRYNICCSLLEEVDLWDYPEL